MEADFSGYATKNGLKCSDGRTIMSGAFKHNDKMRVPLVWQHQHNDPTNILGHAILENREDGVYTYGFFNDSPAAQQAKELVEHKDIKSLSIYANNLSQQGKNVMHGDIREVSLVLAGANPGAFIDNVNLVHGDSVETVVDEAVIYTGLSLEHSEDESDEDLDENEDTETDESEETLDINEVFETLDDDQREVVHHLISEALAHATTQGAPMATATAAKPSSAAAPADTSEQTVQDVFNTLTDDQKNVVYYMIGEALQESGADEGDSGDATHDAFDGTEFLAHIDNKIQEGFDNMAGRNVFDQEGAGPAKPVLSHDQLKTIMSDAGRIGSLKESFLQHAEEYGISDIDLMFPDAKTDGNGVSLLSRRMEWVQSVLSGTKHSPFSRIKSLTADITADEARAKGYVKGNLKKDEIVKMLKRVTTPTTVYKKQKLDRDDVLDITDLDIVAWLKGEMRLMLDEEVARAILVGDGRESDDDDKIDEDSLRPIAYDVDMYNTSINLAVDIDPQDMIDAIVRSLKNYKGTGTPILYTTNDMLTNLILSKDTLGRRFYNTTADLAAALRVSDIIPCEAIEGATDIVGVIVNLTDYTVGADSGGEINMFDNFDIDYNQQRYLIETRISGALTKPKSAITLKVNSGRTITPTSPTFVTSTGVLTVPAQTGTIYQNADTGATYSSGAQTAVASGASVDVIAIPATGYAFVHDSDSEWIFTRS